MVPAKDEGKREVDLTEEEAAQAAEELHQLLSEEDAALLDKHRRTLIGSYSHTLDSKGRLVVPLAFRELLGDSFCIAPSFDFKSIAVYPELQYARMREGYDRLVKAHMKPQLQRYLQQFDAFSYRNQECDGQGRVLLPARIRQVILGDEKDVEITGAGDHVCIVPKPSFDEGLQDFLASLPETLEMIGTLSE